MFKVIQLTQSKKLEAALETPEARRACLLIKNFCSQEDGKIRTLEKL